MEISVLKKVPKSISWPNATKKSISWPKKQLAGSSPVFSFRRVKIAQAIGHALKPHFERAAAQMKGAGPEKLVLAGGLQVDRSKIGKAEGLTLADARGHCTKRQINRSPW